MPSKAFFARARAAAEREMKDTCVIRRDPAFVLDSALNEATGELTPPANATVDVYAGKCTVTPEARQDDEDSEGGAPVVRRAYRATIPIDAPEVAVGDVLTVTASQEDPQLVDKTFVVGGSAHGTFAFSRRLSLDQAVRADAQ